MLYPCVDEDEKLIVKCIFNKFEYSGGCNGAVNRVPGGVIRIGGFSSEGVLVIWSHRYTV